MLNFVCGCVKKAKQPNNRFKRTNFVQTIAYFVDHLFIKIFF